MLLMVTESTTTFCQSQRGVRSKTTMQYFVLKEMYQKSKWKLLKALLFQSQEKNVSIPFQLSVTTISTQLGFSLTARKRQIQWTTKTYSVLKCQYSPLHEFVSGACSRPSSCGIKVFYRKLSRPTFTNKVHIYAVVFYQGVVKYKNNGEKMSEIS